MPITKPVTFHPLINFSHLPDLSLASLTTDLVPPSLNTQPNEIKSRAGGHPDGQAFAPHTKWPVNRKGK